VGPFVAADSEFERRVRDSFVRQTIMATIGARLAVVEPGRVVIELPYRADLCQQHGFIHAGIVGTVADSAGGYAGFSLMPADASVLSVEYHMHLLAPADGERLWATGRVVRAGRTLTTCELEVEAEKNGTRTRCAWGSQTLICVQNRRNVPAG